MAIGTVKVGSSLAVDGRHHREVLRLREVCADRRFVADVLSVSGAGL